MNNNNKNLTLELLLQSLENDFDKQERELIFDELKNTIPADDALLGAKLILEQNNWDYKALKHVFSKVERRIENLVYENSVKKSKTNYLKYAAVLIPIVIITGYFINPTRKESIDEYYIEEAGLPSLMGAKKTNWDELMELYKSNKFEKALALAEKIKVQKPENDTVIYFQGVIAYDLKKYNLAKEGFEKVIKNKQSAFYNDAEFRLGFALKQINQNKESIHQFEIVKANNNNPYGDEAAKVLKILDSSK
jgi:tetratricopeptide (TPR) repeat protein